jgi:RNA polymerase sigma-70 factor (ECF subfamily)
MYIQERVFERHDINAHNEDAIECSDRHLVARVVAGDHSAFDILVCRYSTPLFSFIRRHLADNELSRDVLQFVFLKLYMFIPKLHANWSTLHTNTPLKAWLFQVAWNRCMDERRRRQPLLFCELEPIYEEDDAAYPTTIPDTYPLPEEVAEYHDLQKALRHAIQSLPPKFRSVVELRYTEELSFGEIGRLLNMPENTAKTYFQRARPLLRAALVS